MLVQSVEFWARKLTDFHVSSTLPLNRFKHPRENFSANARNSRISSVKQLMFDAICRDFESQNKIEDYGVISFLEVDGHFKA